MTTVIDNSSKSKLWRAAIKLPLYSVALIPLWVGTTVAIAETRNFNTTNFLIFLFASICIQVWVNVSNDVFDAETGVDVNKLHSLINLTGKETSNFWLWFGNLFLIIGILTTSLLAFWQKDVTLLILVLLACLLGYSYQGPPFRLGYKGIGEIICFITYGPLSVSAAYYNQNPTWSLTALAASVIVGLSTSLILFCAHFHQVEDDLAGGKYSPVVRLGTAKSAQVLSWWGYGIYFLIAVFVLLKIFPPLSLLSFLSLFYALKLFSHVNNYHDQPNQVSNCKFIAISMYLSLGLLLGIGFLLPSV
ncbi:2-carboxy-1,4-naphthoquinone phytyltransferase [Brasilonema sp. CT11]|nr:2-carboxy-1,4-naphthoquinone phytyltransferase [Brasilonema sp. CT11]